MKRTELNWERYDPYSNFPREGWRTRIGKLIVYVHERFRLLSTGDKIWVGYVEGCSASISLFKFDSVLSADQAREKAANEIAEVVHLSDKRPICTPLEKMIPIPGHDGVLLGLTCKPVFSYIYDGKEHPCMVLMGRVDINDGSRRNSRAKVIRYAKIKLPDGRIAIWLFVPNQLIENELVEIGEITEDDLKLLKMNLPMVRFDELLAGRYLDELLPSDEAM